MADITKIEGHMGILAGQWNVVANAVEPQSLLANQDAAATNAYALADAMLRARSSTITDKEG